MYEAAVKTRKESCGPRVRVRYMQKERKRARDKEIGEVEQRSRVLKVCAAYGIRQRHRGVEASRPLRLTEVAGSRELKRALK